jgi:hypothetical protein
MVTSVSSVNVERPSGWSLEKHVDDVLFDKHYCPDCREARDLKCVVCERHMPGPWMSVEVIGKQDLVDLCSYDCIVKFLEGEPSWS